MAAGAGRRMGGVPKALLRRGGESLLARQVRLATAAGVAHVVVVLGHYAEQLANALDGVRAALPNGAPTLDWTVNPAPDDGTGSSLRCGLAALPDGLAACLVMLADQPLLETGDVRAVLGAWQARATGIELVVPRYANRLGHPVVFGPGPRHAVQDARDDEGIRDWRRAHPDRVALLPATHPRYTTDVDTPADLDRLRDEFGANLDWPEM